MSNNEPIQHDILVMKDPFDGYKIPKGDLPDLPFRIEIIGKSQYAGKTNLVANLLLRPTGKDDVHGQDYYMHNFKGENIYVISPSTSVDHKWAKLIEYKGIPPQNVFHQYNEEDLEGVYEKIQREYAEALEARRAPPHSLVILDDCSFDGSLKSKLNGAITKIFCNGRHYLISCILTSQKYSDILTTCRENYTCMFLFECSDKQLDLIYEDIGIGPKPEFKRMFRQLTKEPHSFMVVNAKFPAEERFQDMHFRPYRV